MENEVRTLRSMRLTLFVCTVMVWGWGYIILNNIEGLAFALAALLPVLVALPLLLLTLRFTTRLRGLTGPKLFANRRVIWLYMAGLVVTVVGFVLAQVIARGRCTTRSMRFQEQHWQWVCISFFSLWPFGHSGIISPWQYSAWHLCLCPWRYLSK
jgi:hypothetical protein